jgi:hypothetical protein
MTRKITTEFTLDDENIVFGFLDEMDISVHSIFEEVLMKNHPQFTEKDAENILERHYDQIYDYIQSEINNEIISESYEEEEIEESSGLWGHYKFEYTDEGASRTKNHFENLLNKILTEVIAELAEQGLIV